VPGEYTIGRAPGSSILIEVGPVSRHHARLVVAPDGAVSVEDLGSANGTLLGDRLITGLTLWLTDQILQIGEVILRLLAIPSTRTSDDYAPTLSPSQFAEAEPPVTPPSPVPIAPLESISISQGEAAIIQRHLPLQNRKGQQLDVQKEIARGGMGAVLEARESATRRTVAMKVMLRDGDPKSTLRFIEEAQVTAQLEHPNIVPVYDLSVDDAGQPFYTMKMVAGITLKKVLELIKEGRPETIAKYSLGTLLTIFQKICDALAFAHSKGVIHRDLKPANIMLGRFGEVMVMDWGLAKVLGSKRTVQTSDGSVAESVASARQDEDEVFSTMAGSVMGTPHYMSPEQARGETECLMHEATCSPSV
jgi:eukaryotic-like serine/threonine-protein kinase